MENYLKVKQKLYSNLFSRINTDKIHITINYDLLTTGILSHAIGNTEYDIVFYSCIDTFNGHTKPRYLTSTCKLFTYAISCLKGNVSEFRVSTFFNDRLLDNVGYNRNILKSDIVILNRQTCVIEWLNDDSCNKTVIIESATLNNGLITITFNPEFVEFINKTFFYLPELLLSTNDKLYPHAWGIGYEIYLQVMQNHRNGEFNLNIGRLVKMLPFKQDITLEKKKRIYEPFKRSCEYLNQLIPSLEIVVPEYTRNFLTENIKIKITDQNLLSNYNNKTTNITLIREDNKIKIIKQIRRYRNEGFTIKQIAETLKISQSTVKRYTKKCYTRMSI